ncbi:unnamed protein product [Sphagnum troendelagicum]|uniref:Leucine-rich repeat-containing N-terminal plant-type domain-containing protein n=1 Tax=Sphagnum troendelagicum TaxID=128251 RepID=A0ABP0UQB5_9BRYO
MGTGDTRCGRSSTASGRTFRRCRCVRSLAAAALSLLFLAVEAAPMVGAVTYAGDIAALVQVKLAVNTASVLPSSCLGSWNFSVDPCDALASPQFTCGIDCTPGIGGELRVSGLRLEPAGYEGMLSPYIGNLSALQIVIVSGNKFGGPIPGTLGQLTDLFQLDLSANYFTGPLPESLGLLSNLGFLSVGNNLLEGQIPVSFNNLSKVTEMFLYRNRLNGPLPVLTGMRSLTYVDASYNNLTGHLPWGYPAGLAILALGQNQLAGRLPQLLGNLNSLAVLDLRSNQLTGSIEDFIFDLPSLQQLNLSHNAFSTLSTTNLTGANSQIVSIDLSYNMLRGPLPEFLGFMKMLNVLSLRSNMFTGPIPYNYALKAANSLPATNQLRQLYLDSNFLTGEVPSPFLTISDNITASFVNNCLQMCPQSLSFCQGGGQRSPIECQAFFQTG